MIEKLTAEAVIIRDITIWQVIRIPLEFTENQISEILKWKINENDIVEIASKQVKSKVSFFLRLAWYKLQEIKWTIKKWWEDKNWQILV
jgi:hypothetical protein